MILQLIESSVICYLDENKYLFDNGRQAYEQLGIKNYVKSIKALNNQIIVELSHKDDNYHWEEEYKEQFGIEPSFF